MLNRLTIIGVAIGIAIFAIGLAYIVTNPPFPYTKNIDEKIGVDKIATYEFTAPKSSHEAFKVTGESFHVKLQTPADGIQKDEDFKKEIAFDWYVLGEGTNKILVNNTGNSELQFQGEFVQNSDPLLFTHALILLTTGVVIIGFSAGFSARKPKGF